MSAQRIPYHRRSKGAAYCRNRGRRFIVRWMGGGGDHQECTPARLATKIENPYATHHHQQRRLAFRQSPHQVDPSGRPLQQEIRRQWSHRVTPAARNLPGSASTSNDGSPRRLMPPCNTVLSRPAIWQSYGRVDPSGRPPQQEICG
jgi:hypothetical protein